MTMRPARTRLVSTELAAELAEVGYESLTPENADRLRGLARDGAFIGTSEPTYVVYRLRSGEHQQTGVVVEVEVEAYRDGRIRAHEATEPERVRRLESVLEETRLELVPLTLAHQPDAGLRAALAAASADSPDVRVATERVQQAAWIVRDAELARAIDKALPDVAPLYIADGHHRIAAADEFAVRHHRPGTVAASDFILGALFPWDEVRILGYHRGVCRPAGRTADDLIAAIAGQSAIASVDAAGSDPPSAGPGVPAMHLDGQWYRIRLNPAVPPNSPRDALDLAIFDVAILGSALEIADPATDPRVSPIPGTVDAAGLAQRCAERDEIGFLFHPPSPDQVRAISDAGQVMPRKATWFDPKARTGPFLRDLDL